MSELCELAHRMQDLEIDGMFDDDFEPEETDDTEEDNNLDNDTENQKDFQ